MSALAFYLLQKKESVSGSDLKESDLITLMRKKGAKINLPHNDEVIRQGMSVIYSSSISLNNCEFLKAKELGCPLLHRSSFLTQLTEGKKTLYVTGAHGKTSTSALLSHLLYQAGKEPSFILGGIPHFTRNHGYAGEGEYFVLEADESDGSFLKGTPFASIVTNIEAEHLDYWKSFSALKEAYYQFCEKSTHLFYNGDDPLLKRWKLRGTPYFDHEIIKGQQEGNQLRFQFRIAGKISPEFSLNWVGCHQVKNALAVYKLALFLGIEEEEIAEGFSTFKGVKRRADYLGSIQGVDYFDDYAHHPSECRSILESFRKAFPGRRILALFEPHKYSRFQYCTPGFLNAFNACDELIITNIYPSGEKPIPGVSVEGFQEKLNRSSHYVPYERLSDCLEKMTRENDLVITLGAGLITQIGRRLFEEKNRPS